jgi:ribosome-associated protein
MLSISIPAKARNSNGARLSRNSLEQRGRMCEDANMESDKSKSVETVTVRAEPIDLFKLLKLDGMVGGGGEAKLLIADGQVRVNGQIETRKRKKIFSADVVSYLDRRIRVEVVPANGPSPDCQGSKITDSPRSS